MLPSPAQPAPQSTQHAVLVAWGHFAQELDLVAPFLTIPIPQKTVHQPPAAKLLTLFLLTGRPVSSASHSYPGAAFGYMDGAIRLGYQLAAVCLQTRNTVVCGSLDSTIPATPSRRRAYATC